MNLSLIQGDEIGKIIEVLLSSNFFLTKAPFSVSLYEKVKNEKYHGKFFDLIRIGIDN